MIKAEITTEEIERLGFTRVKVYSSSSGSWGMWVNEQAGRRLNLWECRPCYFDVSRDGVNWQMVNRLRWPYTANDVASAMRELGWV